MFDFVRKRIWKEQVKLVVQNYLACRYLLDFERISLESGLKSGSHSLLMYESELSASTNQLESLYSGDILPATIVEDIVQANKSLRRIYESIRSGKGAFATLVGDTRKGLQSFDSTFIPRGGWKNFIDTFRATGGHPRQLGASCSVQGTSLGGIRETTREWFHEMGAVGVALAQLDALANIVERAKQDREGGKWSSGRPNGSSEDSNREEEVSTRRFFLVDRTIPAVEPEPGTMLLLCSDGSWGEIKPSEVLGDEGSPQVSEEVFRSVVAKLGGDSPL